MNSQFTRRSLRKRASRDPCPAGNNTIIGTTQKFQVTCGLDIPGNDMVRQPAQNMYDCVNLCTQYHPRCVAVAYEADELYGTENCFLKSDVSPPMVRTYLMDYAVGISQSSADDCTSLSGTNNTYTVQGTEFQVHCGDNYPHDDLAQVHASSMADCLNQCLTFTGCVSVTYQSSQASGYNNCYFKGTANPGLLLGQPTYDSAISLGPASGGSTVSSSASVVVTSGGKTITVSLSGDGSSTTISITGSESSASTAHFGTTSSSQSLAGSPQSSAGSSQAQTGTPKSSSSSLAWISGAILGPLFLIALVAALFFALRNRHSQRNGKLSDKAQPLRESQAQQIQQPGINTANTPFSGLEPVPWEVQNEGLHSTGWGDERVYGGELHGTPVER
jgi:PAN domain